MNFRIFIIPKGLKMKPIKPTTVTRYKVSSGKKPVRPMHKLPRYGFGSNKSPRTVKPVSVPQMMNNSRTIVGFREFLSEGAERLLSIAKEAPKIARAITRPKKTYDEIKDVLQSVKNFSALRRVRQHWDDSADMSDFVKRIKGDDLLASEVGLADKITKLHASNAVPGSRAAPGTRPQTQPSRSPGRRRSKPDEITPRPRRERPTKPAEEPAKPAEPVKEPVKPKEPTEPVKEPAKPAEQPIQPKTVPVIPRIVPKEPTKPAEPVKEPVKPAEQPVQPKTVPVIPRIVPKRSPKPAEEPATSPNKQPAPARRTATSSQQAPAIKTPETAPEINRIALPSTGRGIKEPGEGGQGKETTRRRIGEPKGRGGEPKPTKAGGRMWNLPAFGALEKLGSLGKTGGGGWSPKSFG